MDGGLTWFRAKGARLVRAGSERFANGAGSCSRSVLGGGKGS